MGAIQQILAAGKPLANFDYGTTFFTASGVSNGTQQSAINQLVSDLITAGLLDATTPANSKLKALYPFVGGDATKHSYNLVNPTTFQITWNGTVTHNANGITPNGTTGYGDTGLNMSTQLSTNDFSMGVYSRTATTSVSAEIGASTNSTVYCEIYCKYTDNKMYCEMYATGGSSELTATPTNSQGLFTGTRRGTNTATDLEIYRNGTSLANGTAGTGAGSLPNKNAYIGASNNVSGAAEFSARNLALAFIGKGLSDTDVSNLYTAVQTFQTTLSRQV